jgi:hypothetical protein
MERTRIPRSSSITTSVGFTLFLSHASRYIAGSGLLEYLVKLVIVGEENYPPNAYFAGVNIVVK